MRYSDRTITSIAGMINALRSQAGRSKVIWFRGHGRKIWKLIPQLARTRKNLSAENAIVKRFMQNATPHIPIPPREEWEWMFLMQHHRAYTRLLDWSESPLTALYFAVTDETHRRAQGVVWCLDPIALNKEAKVEFEFEAEIPAFGRDKILDSYLPTRVHEGTAKLNPIATVGPRNTARMAAQLGTFTINHRLHTPIEEIGATEHVWRWIIPAQAKNAMADELALLGYRSLTVFPELDRVSDLTRELLR
jgi:hypothetical protein